MSAKKTVLIAGGGGAGTKLARALSEKLDSSKYNLVLVSSRPYYTHLPAQLRVLVTAEGALENTSLIPYDKLFVKGNGIFKHGTIKAIHADKFIQKGGEVVLESGETIQYDVLALAPGSHWEKFLTYPHDGDQTKTHIQEWRKKFKTAKKVVVAGGGAVGIELAGELRDFYPEKEVTLVHGAKLLLNSTYPDKFRKDMETRMRQSKVKLILDDYIDEFPATATRKGTKLDADLIVPARGPRPNTEFIAESFGSDVITDRGLVKIRPTMQLESYPTIFALGDVIDYPEQKQLGKYYGHSDLVTANVLSLLSGAEPKKEYKGTFEAIIITNGRKGGAGYFNVLWGIMLGNGIAASLKSKELFVAMTRKQLGYTS